MPTIHWSVLVAALALVGGGIALLMTDTSTEAGTTLIGVGVGLLGPSAFGKRAS